MADIYYIKAEDSAVAILWGQALAHGKVRWIGDPDGNILDSGGNVIGYYYRDRAHSGWSVWTKNFAGYADPEELEIRATSGKEE